MLEFITVLGLLSVVLMLLVVGLIGIAYFWVQARKDVQESEMRLERKRMKSWLI